MTPVLLKKYREEVVPHLMQEFGLKNKMQAPRILKVVVNVGYGRQAKEQPFIENVENTLSLITGQKPVHHKSKKSISNFKVREGMNIGVSVTMRGPRMYEFLYRFIHLTLPRVRDFRGLNPKSFDVNGNYTLGFKENNAFPEIRSTAVDKIHGLEVTVVTNASKKEEGLALLKGIGFPFKEK